jgi:DNA-binding NarL/FixJ family response regulator
VSHSILIVDDSPLIRRLLRCYIEQDAEWKVCGEAENGAIAVESVRHFNPDVVILDWQMPIMNGLDAARIIAQIAPKTLIVMFTMHCGEQFIQEAQKAGINHVLSKADTKNLFALLKTMAVPG